MLHVKSKKEVRRIKTLVDKRRHSTGIWNEDLDFYNEHIYTMNNQQVKNLNELDDYAVLSDNSSTIGAPITKNKTKIDKDHTLNLNRTVIIRQYAPKTFQKIRFLNNIKDNDVFESLEPSKNIK